MCYPTKVIWTNNYFYLVGHIDWPMCWYLNDVTFKYYSKYMFMGGGAGTLIYMLDRDIIQIKRHHQRCNCSVRVLKYKGCWIGLCRCEKMTNEIIGFGHLIWFFLFTLSELTFKCVIGLKKFQANGITRFGGLNLFC